MAKAGEKRPTNASRPWRPDEDLLAWLEQQFAHPDDIFQASIFGVTAYVTREPEFAYHVLVENWRNYVKGSPNGRVALLLGEGLMASEGELWTRQRRMIQPAFHREFLAASFSMIRAVSERLRDDWRRAAAAGETVNVTRAVSGAALEVVLRFLFGDDYDLVAPDYSLLTREHARNMSFAREFRALDKVVRAVVARRARQPVAARDALELMLAARDPQRGEAMAEQLLMDEVRTLVVAGHETTASTLNWAWYLLSQHAEVRERIESELGRLTLREAADLVNLRYTRQVIEETLRLYPPGWLLYRRALAEDRLGEYLVPAAMEVYVSPYFIQRHPRIWEFPERFDPERFDPARGLPPTRLAMIPFSAGPRNCVGERLARMEMEIHLAVIAAGVRMHYLPSGQIELEAGVNLRSRSDFSMRPETRGPATAKTAAC